MIGTLIAEYQATMALVDHCGNAVEGIRDEFNRLNLEMDAISFAIDLLPANSEGIMNDQDSAEVEHLLEQASDIKAEAAQLVTDAKSISTENLGEFQGCGRHTQYKRPEAQRPE